MSATHRVPDAKVFLDRGFNELPHQSVVFLLRHGDDFGQADQHFLQHGQDAFRWRLLRSCRSNKDGHSLARSLPIGVPFE